MIMVEIDRTDAKDLEKIRLRALRESPDAFCSTYEEESLLTKKDWRDRAAQLAKPRHIGTFMINPTGVCGLIQATPDPEREHVAWLSSLFVEPMIRRQGWGVRLVEHVLVWGRENDFSYIHLEVASSNAAAMSLFHSCGFALAGHWRAHPRLPGVKEYEFRRRIR